jgi:hypothetical protein
VPHGAPRAAAPLMSSVNRTAVAGLGRSIVSLDIAVDHAMGILELDQVLDRPLAPFVADRPRCKRIMPNDALGRDQRGNRRVGPADEDILAVGFGRLFAIAKAPCPFPPQWPASSDHRP